MRALRALRLAPSSLLLLVAALLLCLAAPVQAQTRWALLIGVDQYEDGAENSGRITRLFGAVADANELGKALTESAGFPAANVVRLTTSGTGGKPTKNAILDALSLLQERVQKGDTVFVFYAGHGCEDTEKGITYLLPYDAKARNSKLLRDTALPLDTFNDYLRNIPAGLLILAFDMCRVEVGRSGDTSHTATLQTRSMNFATAKASTAANGEELPQVVVKWFACKPGQKSYESQTRKRGYFSWWLEQGLRGDAAEGGQVTLSSLLNYVSPKVRSEVDKIEGAAQVPSVSFDGANTLADLSRFVFNTAPETGPETATAKEPAVVPPPSGDLPARKTNPKDGAEMILIPAGQFLMGDSDQSDNPRHTVHLSSYYIYKNLVTVGMYEKFCQATGRAMPSAPSFNPAWSMKDHPIVNVTWQDAKSYCDWAGMLLPTEAQWEKAARGMDGRQYPWGNEFDNSRLWSSVKSERNGTAPVGSFPSGASPYGVLDMAGNVCQWCSDWYDEDYLKSSPSQNPTGPGFGDKRVLRGGSWGSTSLLFLRAADRDGEYPAGWFYRLGFRCASPLMSR